MNRPALMMWLALGFAALAFLAAPAVAADPAAPAVKPEMLLKQPEAKVVRITLAPGAVLPTHTTPVHATVAAMSGQGEVTIADKKHALPTHGVVFLPKEIPHAVTNTGAAPLVLLVHHLVHQK